MVKLGFKRLPSSYFKREGVEMSFWDQSNLSPGTGGRGPRVIWLSEGTEGRSVVANSLRGGRGNLTANEKGSLEY